MKYTKLLILTLLTAMTFSACGTDDSLQFNFPDKENNGGGNNGGGNTGGNTGGGSTGESTDKNNTNKNVATAQMPAVVKNPSTVWSFQSSRTTAAATPSCTWITPRAW